MAAAITASHYGSRILLLDEQPTVGGQIYRNVDETAASRPKDMKLLGPDYEKGLGLSKELNNKSIAHIQGAKVWNIEENPSRVFYSVNGKTFKAQTEKIIIATGALERAVPLPGWTKTGVMGAGAAQVMLKSNGMTPSGKIIIAGSGPLLLLVADQLARSQCDIAAVLETTRISDYIRAAPLIFSALKSPKYLIKGLKLRASLKRQGVKLISGVSDIQAHGEQRISAVSYKKGHKAHRLNTEMLLIHEGVVPNVQITRLLKANHEWYGRQDYWRPVKNKWGEISCGGIFIAGDGGGIDGAIAAEASGRLAAFESLFQLNIIGRTERDRLTKPIFKVLRKNLAIRPFLDTLFPPPRYISKNAKKDTIICRCSEITVGDIKKAVNLGCRAPDQVKSYCRSGMGPCQGRICGLAVSALIAEETGNSHEATGYYNIRAPIKPLSLSELSSLEDAPKNAGAK